MEKTEHLIKGLALVKKELTKRDLLYNLNKIPLGDYILSFRRYGGGLSGSEKDQYSLKKLLNTFGYLEVNNIIIPKRHAVIKKALLRNKLIHEDSLIEYTFKTDSYWIRTSDFSEEKIKSALKEIKAEMKRFIGKKAGKKTIDYGITVGYSVVEKMFGDLSLLFRPEYYSLNQWFWQRIAKSNSIKAAILAEIEKKDIVEFSKEKFDNAVREMVLLNSELKNSKLMKKSGKNYVLRDQVAENIKNYEEAYQYFSRLKLLEEIINTPRRIPDMTKQYVTTKRMVKSIDNSLRILEECRNRKYTSDETIEQLHKISRLSSIALKQLNIDHRNPEFSSDLKFFQNSGSLKIGNYYLILIDVRKAGIKIRQAHEKMLLDYNRNNYSNSDFISLALNSYEGFLSEIFNVQKKVKRICEKYTNEDVSYLAFGDEVFVLIPDNENIQKIMNGINKYLDVNTRIVSTQFNVNEQINNLGTGNLVIDAFKSIMHGDKVIKNYEETQKDFRNIVLVDKNFSVKILEEIEGSLEDIEKMFVFTSMLSGE